MNIERRERWDEQQQREIVSLARAGDVDAQERMMAAVRASAKWIAFQNAPFAEVEDVAQQTALVVWESVLDGSVESLFHYANSVAKYLSYAACHRRYLNEEYAEQLKIHLSQLARRMMPNPEQSLKQDERDGIVHGAVEQIANERHREILVRRYLFEQPREQIIREMHITPTQYRLGKSRGIHLDLAKHIYRRLRVPGRNDLSARAAVSC